LLYNRLFISKINGMRTYLKKFNTHSEYAEYIASSGYVSPNLSICDEEGHVEYDPSFIVHSPVEPLQ